MRNVMLSKRLYGILKTAGLEPAEVLVGKALSEKEIGVSDESQRIIDNMKSKKDRGPGLPKPEHDVGNKFNNDINID